MRNYGIHDGTSKKNVSVICYTFLGEEISDEASCFRVSKTQTSPEY